MHYVLASSKPWHQTNSRVAELFSSDSFVWACTPDQLQNVIKLNPDIRYIFFLHWNWLVPENVWKNQECVCFHMTDVPYGRGGSPLQNLIVRGHKVTVLTALRMEAEMDAGAVYVKYPLSLAGTAHEIYQRAADLSFEIIQWLIEDEPQPQPQQGVAEVFKRRKTEQSKLPESGTIASLYDHIRMLDAPTYPLAFVEHGDFFLELSDAEVVQEHLTATVTIRRKSNQREI